MAKIDELHNYAYPDKYLDELHIYDKSKGVSDFDEVHNYGNRGVTYGMDELHLYGSYQTEEIAQDEVNKPTERELIDIDEYFDEIEALDEEQKEERKNLAEEFKDILQLLFALILADLRVGNEINEGFYLSLGKSRCMGAVDRLMPHLTIDVYTQIENYIHQNLTYVIESTVRNQADAYYFSEERATAIAVDDAMASANLEELELAKKNGVKFKIWTAFKDDKVRKTHKEVDGKKVAIDKPFKVGRCLMQAPMIFDEKSVFQDAKEVINCRCSLTWSNNADKEEKNLDKIVEEESLRSAGGDYGVNTSIIKSKEYAEKFNAISDNDKANALALKRAKRALINRNGKNTEELYAISLKNGTDISSITDQNTVFGVNRTPKFTADLNKAIEKDDKILFIHNHPRSKPPSLADINELIKTPNSLGITVGHNGNIFLYGAPKEKLTQDDFDVAYSKLPWYNGTVEDEVRTIEQLSKDFDFVFKEL